MKNESRLKAKKICCIGDSITWLDTNTKPEYDEGKTTFIGYQQYFRDAGATVDTLAQCGATLRKYVKGDNMMHGCILENVRKEDVSSADIITIFGGCNDVGRGLRIGALSQDFDGPFDEDTTVGALQALIAYIRAQNKHCEIFIIIMPYSALATRPAPAMEQMCKALIETANAYGFKYIDLYHDGGINASNHTEYLYDGIHPNNAGYKKIGAVIYDHIENRV